MRARGWFHCPTCLHRARAVVSDGDVRDGFAAVLSPMEPRTDDPADYRGAATVVDATIEPSLDEHPQLARTLSMVRCPKCGARDRRAVLAGWLRALVPSLALAVLPMATVALAYTVRVGLDLATLVRREPEVRGAARWLALVSIALGVLALWVQRPRAESIDRRVRWDA